MEWLWGKTGKTRTLSQCQFIYHKSHMDSPGLGGEKPATKALIFNWPTFVNVRSVTSDCLNSDTVCTIIYEGKTGPNDDKAVASKTRSCGFLIFGRDYYSYSHPMNYVYYSAGCLQRAIHCTEVGIRPLLEHIQCVSSAGSAMLKHSASQVLCAAIRSP
jgi:hypothetical protein